MGIALSWLAVGFLRLLFSLFSFLFISCIKIYLSNFIFIFFLLPLFSSCFLLGVGTKMAARQFKFIRKKKKKTFQMLLLPLNFTCFLLRLRLHLFFFFVSVFVGYF